MLAPNTTACLRPPMVRPPGAESRRSLLGQRAFDFCVEDEEAAAVADAVVEAGREREAGEARGDARDRAERRERELDRERIRDAVAELRPERAGEDVVQELRGE